MRKLISGLAGAAALLGLATTAHAQDTVKVGLIMDETRARMDEVHRGTIPAQQEIRREQMDKMRSMLSPEQKLEYDRLQKEREDRIKKGGPRGGPGGF